MKKSKNDASAAKAFHERYARILGLEPFSTPETPKKSSLRRRALENGFILKGSWTPGKNNASVKTCRVFETWQVCSPGKL